MKIEQQIRENLYKVPTKLERAKQHIEDLKKKAKGEMVGCKQILQDNSSLIFFSKTEDEKLELMKKIALMGNSTSPIFDFTNTEQVSKEDDNNRIINRYLGAEIIATEIYAENSNPLYFALIDGEPISLTDKEYLKYLNVYTATNNDFDVETVAAKINLAIAINFQGEIEEKIKTIISSEKERMEQATGETVKASCLKKFEATLFNILSQKHASIGLPDITENGTKRRPIYSYQFSDSFFYEIGTENNKIKYLVIDMDGNFSEELKEVKKSTKPCIKRRKAKN